MNLNFISAATAVFTLVMPVSASAASLLLNGSFESDPGVTSQGGNGGGHGRGRDFANLPVSGASWGIWNDGVAGWTTASQGIEFQTQRTLGLTPSDGDYYVELDTVGNSSITQDVFLTVGTYELSFAYSPRTGNSATNGVSYGIAGLAGIVTGSSDDFPIGEWNYVTERFEVTDEMSYTLNFAATGISDRVGGFIDDVSLSAVPVPAGLLLMGTALAGLGMVRRKKR